MEPLPRGAQFVRAKMLWEIALGVAGDINIPYYGNRDIKIDVGNASGEHYKPYLRMSVGSPILAHAVVREEIEMAFVNPSAFVTQAYRGTGLFSEPLPVRIVVSYPSWDRYVHCIHERTGITSLKQIKEQKYPLRLSIREDATHSTRVLLDQELALLGFTLDDLVSWGGSLQLNGGPGDRRRLEAIEKGEVDAVFDEGIPLWFDKSLAAGMRPITLEDDLMKQLETIGWRRAMIPAGGRHGEFPHLKEDHWGIDYSGWPLYTRASLPDEIAYKVCDAVAQRAEEIPWEEGAYTGIGQIGRESDATPMDVPLHPGAAQWFKEHGYDV
ncbi:MAG TPA: TAXI family TRAP transporter solute-binding subunit [Chloroflexota bacterium]|nr:TAXI family TRAP transporter solute-binding subunit [Chloroflexota bacterium]